MCLGSLSSSATDVLRNLKRLTLECFWNLTYLTDQPN